MKLNAELNVTLSGFLPKAKAGGQPDRFFWQTPTPIFSKSRFVWERWTLIIADGFEQE
jgi:hypothetical protein